MKNLITFVAAGALATTMATGVLAGETTKTIKPLAVKSLTVTKSTQSAPPTSLGLGGLGAGGGAGLLALGIIAVVAIAASSTSGT